MRTIIISAIFCFAFYFSNAQDYEMNGKDTLNMTDANAKKQGKWIVFGRNKPGSCYQQQQKIEEGIYKDNKRIGVWTEYHCNSNIKAKISYTGGRPSGHIIFYYDNGTIREEGTWINNRWTGNYKFNYDDGTVMELVFDDKGKEISKKITPPKNSVPSKKK